MAYELASAYVSISPNLRGFKTALRQQLQQDLPGALTQPLAAELRAAEGKTRTGMTRIAGIIKTTLAAAAIAAGAGLAASVAGLGALATVGLKTAAQLEMAQAAYTALTGSATVAAKTLEDLKDFAKVSPFDTTAVIDSGRKLLAYGVTAEDLIPTLIALGNAAAATGLGSEGINRLSIALGQIKAKGRVQAQELLQIQETGIPATQILAENLGLTQRATLDLVEKGLVPADFAVKALLQGMENGTKGVKGFAGLMQEQAKTLAGVWQNFKDSTRLALADGLTPYLQPIASSLYALIPSVERFAAAFGKAFGPALATTANQIAPALVTIAEALGPAIGQVFTALAPVLASAAPSLGSLAVAAGNLASTLLTALQPALDYLYPVLDTVLAALGPALQAIIVAAGPAVTELARALAEMAVALLPLVPPLTDLAVAVLPLFTAGVKLLADSIPVLMRAFGGLAYVVTNAGQVMINVSAFTLRAVLQLVKGVLWALAQVPGPQQAAFQAAKTGFDAFYESVDQGIDKVNEKFETLQDALWAMAEGTTIPLTVRVNYEDEGLPRPRNARGSGSTRPATPRIPKPNLKPVPTYVPPPVDDTNAQRAMKAAADKAKAALEAWQKEVAQFKQGISDTITSFGSVTQFTARGLFAPTSSQVVADMRARVNKARAFFPLVRRLKRLGLNKASLLEIIQAGPVAGTEIARALLAGGSSAISEVNRLESQLQATGADLGGLAAGVKYDGTMPSIDVNVYLNGEALDATIDTRIGKNSRKQQQSTNRGTRTA